MKEILKYLIFNLFLYLLIAFFAWDLTWGYHVANMDIGERVVFSLVLLLFNYLFMTFEEI